MKTLLLTLTYLVGTGELVLAWYFWKTHSGDRIRKTMTFLSLFTGIWVLSIAPVAYAPTGTVPEFMLDMTYFLGVLMVTSVILFSFLFPYPSFRIDVLHMVLLYTPAAIFAGLLFSGTSIIEAYVSSTTVQGTWIAGPMFWVYSLYLIILYVASIAFLVQKLQKAGGVHRVNLRLVIWSLLLGGIPAVWLYLVEPLFIGKANYPLMGTSLTGIWLGFTSYILVKK